MNEKFENLEGRPSIDAFLARQRLMITQASIMADQKASICLALQLGLLSLIANRITSSSQTTELALGDFWWLTPLALANLIAVVLCTYVLMPSIGPRQRPKIPDRLSSPNPLFFSSIAQKTEEEFLDTMGTILQNDNRIYHAVAIDMHRESLVLHQKKYRFLELAYQCFLAGILLTAFLFVIKSVR